MSGASWVERAERAIEGGALEEGDVVLRGARPPILDAEGVRAVAAPLLCAVLWSAAVFREMVAGTSIDPLAFATRILALGVTLRVLLLGARLWKRLRLWMEAERHALALTPEGLLYRSPEVDLALPRDMVLGVVEEGAWQERTGPRRATSVYVVTDPESGRTHITLPPVLDASPGRLAERLSRWRGGWEEPEEPPSRPRDDVPSRTYDEAAAGRPGPGVTALRHDLGWIKRGPYIVLLIGIVTAEGLLRGGPRVWKAVDPAIAAGLVLVAALVFLRWTWMQRREIAPRKGLSMVLSPAALLIRERRGLLSIPWADLVSASVNTKRAWSVLEGAHDARQLVLSRRGAPPVRYDEPYLGLPVEVVQVLVEAYRAGRLPAAN